MKVEMAVLKADGRETRAFTVPNEKWADAFEALSRGKIRRVPAATGGDLGSGETVTDEDPAPLPRKRGRPRKVSE